jgi:acetylornithine deacetylase/succinyl-diaminopimelate desuccinylase-like protein
VVPNPAWDIVWAFASMKRPDERVSIEGFYDDALSPTGAELSCLETIHFDDVGTRRSLGIPALTLGLAGREAVRRLLFEPTLEVSGLGAGRVLDGLKGMPRRAVGVVRFGLVPRQDPGKVEAILRRHLDRSGFQRITLKPISQRHPGKVPIDHPFVGMIIRSTHSFCGQEPVIYPVAPWIGAPYHELADPLGIPLVNVGLGSAEARFHAPDESIDLDDYVESIKFGARLFQDFADLN